MIFRGYDTHEMGLLGSIHLEYTIYYIIDIWDILTLVRYDTRLTLYIKDVIMIYIGGVTV